MFITNTNNDEKTSINDVYFVIKVIKGEAEYRRDPCFREKKDGFRLIGPPFLSVFFLNKQEAIEYGTNIMYAFNAGREDMRQQFRNLLEV